MVRHHWIGRKLRFHIFSMLYANATPKKWTICKHTVAPPYVKMRMRMWIRMRQVDHSMHWSLWMWMRMRMRQSKQEFWLSLMPASHCPEVDSRWIFGCPAGVNFGQCDAGITNLEQGRHLYSVYCICGILASMPAVSMLEGTVAWSTTSTTPVLMCFICWGFMSC